MTEVDISAVCDFLYCETPDAWLAAALEHEALLLIDHANCEKKAASTALNLLYRYVDRPELLHRLSRLAREELRHFEQVLSIMTDRQIDYLQIRASRYAGELHKLVATHEPERLVDTLIVGAFIEARSCERFARLAPLLDKKLQSFYHSLLKSESRHFLDYLELARQYAKSDIESRIEVIGRREAELVTEVDTEFRFHSGPLVAEVAVN